MGILLVVVFGLIPAIVLGLLAFAPLIAGLAMLFDKPDVSSLAILWAVSGIAGSFTLMRAAGGSFSENTIPGLLAGIAAAAPLAGLALVKWDFPSSLFLVYWAGGPIIVACCFIAKRLLQPDKLLP